MLARIVTLRVEVDGPVPQAPFLLVSNHLGYVDIIALSKTVGCCYVSRGDVRDWPGLCGRLVAHGSALHGKVWKELSETTRLAVHAVHESKDEPGQKEVWVFNVRDAQSATVIDAVSHKVVATIPLGGTPELAAADPKAHRLYLNLIDKNVVLSIDTQEHKILATWPLAPCETPTGLVIDVEHHRLFSSCRGKKPVAVMMDNTTGKVLASVPIGQGADEIAYDLATRLIFIASGGAPLRVPLLVTITRGRSAWARNSPLTLP